MLEVLNYEVYGLERAVIAAGLPMSTDSDKIQYSEDRAKRLGNVPAGSGHNAYLKGIVVEARIKYPLYWSKQFQRYHFADIVSSQSTMHRVTKFNLKEQCNKYVDERIIKIVNHKIEMYNYMIENKIDILYIAPLIIRDEGFYSKDYEEAKKILFGDYGNGEELITTTKQDLFIEIISNLPSGFEMEMEIVTNYLQLQTIYNQRKNHKLPDWKVFCEWCESLPKFKEFCLGGND